MKRLLENRRSDTSTAGTMGSKCSEEDLVVAESLSSSLVCLILKYVVHFWGLR